MKKSKFSLILTLIVVLALVAPFATYATEATTPDAAGEPVVTSETPESTESSDVEAHVEDDLTTEDNATAEDSTTTEEAISEDGTATEEPLEEVKGNHFETGTDLVFNKAVDGNVFLIGDNITIKGQVNGDVFVCANTVNLAEGSQILGNLFLIAKDFTHTGLVYNLFAFTTNYTCEYDGLAALDLKVFAENIKFSGYTERSAYFLADNIELTDDAYILGNLVYASNNEPIIGEAATIYGETRTDDVLSMFMSKGGAENESEPTIMEQILTYVISALMLIGEVLLILFLINFFKPNALVADVKFRVSTCFKALFVGILALIVLSIISGLLIASIMFASLGILLLAIMIIGLFLSTIVAILTLAVTLYNKFNKGKSKALVIPYTILVTLVYFGLTFIPVAGMIIDILVNIIGFGLIVLWLFNIRKTNKISKENISTELSDNTEETVDEVKEEQQPVETEIVDETNKDNNEADNNNNDKKKKKDKKNDAEEDSTTIENKSDEDNNDNPLSEDTK